MDMTHYMELLAVNQPWNLILFMAIPVILAETIAIAELYLLYTRNFTGRVQLVSRYASIIAGLYMLVVLCYLVWSVAIPLTVAGQWRGIADMLAVGCYLLAALPLIGLGAIEVGVLAREKDALGKLKLHATLVAIFLVLAHVAMIFGMVDPTVLGWSSEVQSDTMHSMHQ